ncbi:MAG: hypothetical protein Q7J80_00075 [Anaerolineales bacterium]|nr:hypothetical protein [Anaerolineales bacterium]
MQTFTNITNGIKQVWQVERLWKIASELPIKEVPLASISNLDEVSWFGSALSEQPTCRRVADHAKRIYEAKFDHLVILSSAGWVMDGMHRVCKAYLLGWQTIKAVQFIQDPEPDEIVSFQSSVENVQ